MMSVFTLCFALLAIEFFLRFRRAKEILSKEDQAMTEAGF